MVSVRLVLSREEHATTLEAGHGGGGGRLVFFFFFEAGGGARAVAAKLRLLLAELLRPDYEVELAVSRRSLAAWARELGGGGGVGLGSSDGARAPRE